METVFACWFTDKNAKLATTHQVNRVANTDSYNTQKQSQQFPVAKANTVEQESKILKKHDNRDNTLG